MERGVERRRKIVAMEGWFVINFYTPAYNFIHILIKSNILPCGKKVARSWTLLSASSSSMREDEKDIGFY